MVFGDGSREAYSALAYMRWEMPGGTYFVRLIAGKTRVTPKMKVVAKDTHTELRPVLPVPQKSDGRLPKLALGDVEGEAALFHDLKNLPEMLQVLAAVGAAHQVVVGEGEAEREVSKILVDEPLEGLAGVAQPERHVVVLEKAKRSDDRRFRFVSFRYRHLVIPFDEVQLAEDRGAVEVVGEVQHVGQRVPVGGGYLFEAAVVAAGPPSASWLGY